MKKLFAGLTFFVILAGALCSSAQNRNNCPQGIKQDTRNRVLTCANNGRRMSEKDLARFEQGEIVTVIVKGDSLFLTLSPSGLKKFELFSKLNNRPKT